MYLIFLTIPGNESLLKAEISIRYPNLKLSYSTKGLISYKYTDENFSIPKNCFYALMIGKFVEKRSDSSDFERFNDFFPDAGIKIALDSQAAEIELLINQKEVWKVIPTFSCVRSFNFSNELIKSEKFPARSYLKTKQILDYLGAEANLTGLKILDIGSAPGGNTAYLLSKGNSVMAIDPANMDSIPSTNNFVHLKRPVQDIEVREVGFDFDWIMNDMNLPLEYSLKQTLRFCKVQKEGFRGALITLKTPKPADVKNLIESFDRLKSEVAKEHELYALQVPAHRQETAIVLLTKKFFR